MFLKFLKAFGSVKAQQATEKAAELLARMDPNSVTEAAILEVEEQLDVMTEECAKARLEYNREKQEAEAINELNNRRLGAAEKLQNRLDADPSNVAVKEALDELLTTLENTASDVERENAEAKDAKEILEAMEENCASMAQQLKDLRGNADRLKREMVKAEQERERAAAREEQAKVLAGIKKSTSGYSAAMKAMEAATTQAKVEADAAKHRATLLSEPVKKSNSLIEEAMGEVKPTVSTESLQDRLARLKNKA
jgi:hypothetical protein